MISSDVCFCPHSISGETVANAIREYLGFEPNFFAILHNINARKYRPEKDLQLIECFDGYPIVTLSECKIYSLEECRKFKSKRFAPHIDMLSWLLDAPVPDEHINRISDSRGFGCACIHDWDDICWQSEQQVDTYEHAGRPYDPSLVISHPLFGQAIDISRNPGRRDVFPGMLLQPSWKMWFGDWAFKFIARERLLEFSDAFVVRDLGHAVFIQLFEHLEDFEQPESRRRQQAFRDYVDLDSLAAMSGEVFDEYFAHTHDNVPEEDRYYTLPRD